MSTAIHTPCHSPTSSQDFLSFHTCLQDMQESSLQYPLSPCQRPTATPHRQQPLLLTPSPQRWRRDDSFDFDASMQLDFDDFSAVTGSSTPCHQRKKMALSPRPPRSKLEDDLPPFFRPPNPPTEDDEGSFLRSNIGHTSLPLRTPDRPRLDNGRVPGSVASFDFSHAPKRKINRLSSSPNSKRGLTPLHVRHAPQEGEPLKRFATLAPLPAPRFLHGHKPFGNNTGRDVDTLKEMRISDRQRDDDAFSSSEEEFSRLKVPRTTNRSIRSSICGTKGLQDSMSQFGQSFKRRPKSRPTSMEFGDARGRIESPRAKSKVRHERSGSNTSVSNAGSPVNVVKNSGKGKPPCDRRLASSATLFFGPAIVYPQEARVKVDQGSPRVPPPSTPVKADEEMNGTSPESSFTSAFPKPADTSVRFSFSLASDAPSPRSRIPTKFKLRDSGVVLSDDETIGDAQTVGPSKITGPDSLRRLHARASTFPQPSVSVATPSETTLLDGGLVTPTHENSRDSIRPVSPGDASVVDEFIVKTLEAGTKDGATEKRPPGTPQKRTKTAFLGFAVHRPWASAAVEKMDRAPLFGEKLPAPNFSAVMDSGGSADDLSVPKKTLGLGGKPRKSCPSDLRFPVNEANAMNSARSFQSNSSTASDAEMSPTDARLNNSKIRSYGDVGLGRPGTKYCASQLLRRPSSSAFSTTSDGSDGSVTGTPTRSILAKKHNDLRLPMLSAAQLCTPSTNSPRLLPLSPNSPSIIKHDTVGTQFSTRSQISNFGKHTKENQRPESMQGSGSRPTISGRPGANICATPLISKSNKQSRQGGTRGSLLDAITGSSRRSEPLGRFEREFVEVDKIGAGEFGSAIKVRFKHEDRQNRVYAVKRSKRFEGNRHRSRLREEVEVLQHLSACAGPEFHPNVLGYVDSWEQDDRLYILTELCEYGNFAHFLDEYGHHFQRLDEARVWKIFADISSGLRFVHDANVVHFDLKPANIFITSAGRFKIGDFGMASVWPRVWRGGAGLHSEANISGPTFDFEREGDKMYLAAEVLQGRYGKETDVFSFGMMMLETATNIYVPTQGDSWHRLREQDFSQVEGFAECSEALQHLIMWMMSKDPTSRPTANEIYSHTIVSRAREHMQALVDELHSQGEATPEILFKASPLASVDDSFLPDILCGDAGVGPMEMDCTA